ncbi:MULTISPECIES: acyl-CoA thioesterase [unclassified Microbacterium]|uniref:acyl-CoA thioesterase n=1 Tax=unclassified Microbacterium TaxID=2609290 RepID=UPI00214B61EA|nr:MULTISPECIES: thioesterase family protein [unclassified Microbacterium]MCR2801030.1 acyl-CoA thioesterase [Microbacterium sp. zg.Y818]MCR2826462.1 acyl-CoA thioesterase [Microbacterium sp. zg.Y909]WIM23735.1 thioesterase family protein [Microbacterium sp. zg-Y818]
MTDAAPLRIHVPIPLRWGDLDALNHVNNTSMLKLLEEARLRAFWRPDAGMEGPPTAVLDSGLSAGAETMTLIARQEIEYLAPVPYQQRPLDVQLWIGRLGGSSIDVCYDVYSPLGESPRTLYARSTAVVVMVSSATGRPVRLTTEMRQAWAPYVGEPIVYAHRR